MTEKKIYSIYEIAKKTGVSIATVSRVINNSKLVKASTKKQILKVIKELDYRPNFFARNLVKNKSKTIGLLIPDIINPVFPEMAKGISDKAFLNEYTVFLCNTESSIKKEVELLKNLLEKNIVGIIFISTEMNKFKGDFQHYLYLYNKNIPTVFINGMLKDIDIPFVRINEVKAGYIATKHMLKKGLKKIAFLGGSLKFIPTYEKLRGYKKALKEFGVPIEKKYIIFDNYNLEIGFSNTLKLLETSDRPEGIITASDVLAIEVIKASNIKGFNVPRDLKVIGFDDISFSS
ncbi:MAG: LacI family transcriptional regulator, partial [Candidatus Lokiarchaeota archaeon]|nr:LacI family transcriptional regulator [Candidatus Lokiarchaeota archaeon]